MGFDFVSKRIHFPTELVLIRNQTRVGHKHHSKVEYSAESTLFILFSVGGVVMKRIVMATALIFVGMMIGSWERWVGQPAKVTAQDELVPLCKAYVPASWGTFRGVSGTYGMGFEDSSGTFRFVNKFPCSGLPDPPPPVTLELRRK
jgi:hypothetical protein